MNTTIKISNETKKKLDSLDIAGKNKTYDALVADLLLYYNSRKKRYDKDYQNWKKQNEDYQKNLSLWKKQNKKLADVLKEHKENRKTWKKLLEWAKKNGFKR